MADIYKNGLLTASVMAARQRVANSFGLSYISSREVVSEFEKRCANGMQYTTFPNYISDLEKSRLEAAGYIVTRNIVESSARYGAGDLYIGFQVALNTRAAEESMQITPNDGPIDVNCNCGGGTPIVPDVHTGTHYALGTPGLYYAVGGKAGDHYVVKDDAHLGTHYALGGVAGAYYDVAGDDEHYVTSD